MFERFTDGARRAVVLAQEEAVRFRHRHIGAEHLLLGLVAKPSYLAVRLLHRYGVDVDALRRTVIAGRDRRAG